MYKAMVAGWVAGLVAGWVAGWPAGRNPPPPPPLAGAAPLAPRGRWPLKVLSKND